MKRLFPALLATLTAVTTLAIPEPVTPSATVTLSASSSTISTSGGSITFTATTADLPTDLNALAWTVTLPTGWSYAGGTGEPSVTPAMGTTSPLEWAYFTLPTTDTSFTFTAQYPADTLDPVTITAQVILRTDSVPAATTLDVTDLTLTPTPTLGNAITFPAIADKRANDESFTLAATSSSGLPITYTVLSGPALIEGNRVTLTGASGTVVIRASQGGDVYFLPADATTQSFEVTQSGPLVYFGTADDGSDFAINIPEGSSTGTLFGTLPNGQYYILTFVVNDDRTVTAENLELLGDPTTAAAQLARAPLYARAPLQITAASTAPTTGGAAPAADLAYTFTGTLVNGQVVMQIAELGVTLNGTIEPANGATANLAGLYEASSLNNATGTTSSIVGTTGKVYVLAVTPDIITGGRTTIATDGTFTFNTTQNVTILGNVDAPSTTVTGTIILPTGEEDTFQGISTDTLRTDRLINLSTRAHVDATGDGSLITGFVIGGTTDKHVLLRAVGPGLTDYGVADALADPHLIVRDATGTILVDLDDWGDDATVAAAHNLVGAFPLATGSLDASTLITLAPGPYTMQVVNDTTAGVALAEIYDAAENPNAEYQRLINISSRGRVTGEAGVLVGGFIVTGNSPKRVLIRGIGPGLLPYGVDNVLSNPTLKLYNQDQQVIATNDDWQTPAPVFTGQNTADEAEITTTSATVGAFALESGSADAALVITLSPGAYTVHLGPAQSGQSGNALIEVYEIPPEQN